MTRYKGRRILPPPPRKRPLLLFLHAVKGSALYDTGTAAKYGDRSLTLSTCSCHRENGAFVVASHSFF